MRIILPLLALVLASACGGEPAHEPAEHEHEHGEEEELSDLDRPVDELFAATCEHDIPTYTCDECRYEVGVVKVPQALLDDGLLTQEAVTMGPTGTAVELLGELAFEEGGLVRVTAPVAGTLREVRARPGIPVEAGALLFSLESAELSAAEGEYQAALAALDLAERAAARHEELRSADASSERELREALERRSAARIEAGVLREGLVRLGLGTSALDSLAEGPAAGRLAVTAPIAGVPVEVAVAAGERVEQGEVALQIGDPAHLRAEADVYEADLPLLLQRLPEGPIPAEIAVRAFPGERFPGELTALAATMDPTTRTVKARIGLPNPDGRLRPGMFAEVTLHLPGEELALQVPSAAVLQDEGRSFVFVRHDGEYFVRRPVEPIGRVGERTAVRADLQPGELVVADGCFLLKSDVLRSKMGAGCAD